MSEQRIFECQNCKGLYKTEKTVEINKLGCLCGSPNYKLIEFGCDEVDLIEARACYEDAYKDIINLQKQYIDLPEDYTKLISIWIIGTYMHKNFNTYPFLFFNAMRGSGKTRTLKFISALGANGDGSVQNNISDAALFRIPQGTTTCLDEIEQIGSKEKSTLRELLNSAYKRGIKVKRMKKVKRGGEETYVVEEYEPFIPLAMANIWGIEEVLGDRSITLILEKSNNPAVVKKVEDFDTNPIFTNIKRTLALKSDVMTLRYGEKQYIKEWNQYISNKYIVTSSHISYTYITSPNITNTEDIIKTEDFELLDLFNKIDDAGIDGRNFELSFPLLITAKLINDDVFNDIIEVLKRIMSGKKKDEYTESKDVSVYDFVCTMDTYWNEYVPIKELTARFRQFLGEDDDQDRWLNEKWFGRALKRLRLTTASKKTNKGRLVILDIAKSKDKAKIFKTGDEEE
jgi:hypothetical protein